MSKELNQCPFEKACKCAMDEPCEGCETFAEHNNTEALTYFKRAAVLEAENRERACLEIDATGTIEGLKAELAKHQWIELNEDESNGPTDPDEEVLWIEPNGHKEVYNSEMLAKRDVTHYLTIPPLPDHISQNAERGK